MSSWFGVKETSVRRKGSIATVTIRNCDQEIISKKGTRRDRQISRRHFVKQEEFSEVDCGEIQRTTVSVKRPREKAKRLFSKTVYQHF